MENSQFKNDRYKRARGGYSRLLIISCEECGRHICDHQKDGPGILRRIYLDRISNSKKYSGLRDVSIGKIPPMKCDPRDRILGVCVNYDKENRLTYCMFVGVATKKRSKTQ